jgi:hypothetical protein
LYIEAFEKNGYTTGMIPIFEDEYGTLETDEEEEEEEDNFDWAKYDIECREARRCKEAQMYKEAQSLKQKKA